MFLILTAVVTSLVLLFIGGYHLSKKKRFTAKVKDTLSYRGGILRFTTFSLITILIAQVIIFALVFIFLISVKATSINYYTQKIETSFEYRTDLQYMKQVPEERVDTAFRQEMMIYEQALATWTKDDIYNISQDDISFMIESYVKDLKMEPVLPADTLANKVYNRLFDYYYYREYDYTYYLMLSLMLSFTPYLYLVLYNMQVLNRDRRNVNFLKKLIVVNGSIKPVDYSTIIEDLITNATPNIQHRLKKIRDALSNNTKNTGAAFKDAITDSTSLSERLFFENLEVAYNDFDLAIDIFRDEIIIENQRSKRKYRKKAESMNSLGTMIFLVVMTICCLYLIIPWSKLMNFGSLF
ncbi:hypothetical protein ABGV42_00170 [Paenibacillus pabuli]|uniref:hypothetical protein n=1 Tax=Paenibacillus pabuli TaxID=1472 RepID=UPI003241FFD7